jgi:hypothetical protein
MRFVMCSFLIALMLPGASESASSQTLPTAAPDFTLELVAPSGPFRLGEPIHLMLRFTNTTDHVLYIPIPPGPAWGDEMVGVDLVDSAGVPVPKWRDLAGVPIPTWRDLKRQADGGQMNGGSLSSDDVPARAVHERDVRLEKVFKITAGGYYTVRVWRWDPNSHTTVKSEPLEINIVPAS